MDWLVAIADVRQRGDVTLKRVGAVELTTTAALRLKAIASFGRRAYTRTVNIIAIDLGATNTRIALVDARSGAVMQRHKIASTRSEYESSVQKIAHAVSEFPKAPIGIAVAGQLNEQRTIIKHAPNLDWHNVSLADDLAKSTKREVTLENDVRAAALGELRYGGLRDTKATGLLVFWGSGIGGAVTHAGELVRGAHNLAGEVGHMPYSVKGPRCACASVAATKPTPVDMSSIARHARRA